MQYPQAATALERACAHNLTVGPSISFSRKTIISRNRQPAFHFRSTEFGSAIPSSSLSALSISRLTNHSAVRASLSSFSSSSSPWDEKPYQVLPNDKIVYLDEQDVVTFLDPPMELIPLDPSSYNPAFYLWKKIEDIPEERRHRLLSLLNPRLISQAWEISGTHAEQAEVVFRTGDGKAYGRFISESVFSGLSNSFYPLYFTVNGILDLPDFSRGFPKPAEHPWPFNDEIVIYVRHTGPGVMVGQAWQEGKALEQVPKKLCGEILMVKEYLSSQPQSG
ncbi:hypothetical protein K7X08_004207 [Anisodus acutangulus]|uniref:Uncharacterized protein n=1 Tax=Anisodus acutangulus TaxID=402998 RepID=A0A9Q1MI87_9SOLA|nr:hypothetical protein K7X08_004207 [Anisodus acutangulus]